MFLRAGAYIALALLAVFFGWRALTVYKAYDDSKISVIDTARGPADAPVVIVEFFDYRCEACRKAWPVVQEAAARHPDVRFVMRNLPLYELFGAEALREARLALAAGMQGRYAQMHELLIQREQPVQEDEIPFLAQQAGVDYDRLKRDMMHGAVKRTLLDTIDVAEALRINRAPSFLVGRTVYTSPDRQPTAGDFDRLIAAEKARLGVTP